MRYVGNGSFNLRGDLPPQFVGRDVNARSRFASLSQPRPVVDQLCLEHGSLRLDGLQLLDLLPLVAAGFTFKMQSLLDLTEFGHERGCLLVQSHQLFLLERKRKLRLPQFRL
jgi:hypothetical protein